MREEKVLKKAVVTFVVNEESKEILLAIKKDKIGKGCWNGYGGGLEAQDGGSLRKAAVREVREESRKKGKGIIVKPEDLLKVAIMNCHNTKTDGSSYVCELHVFLAFVWTGEAEESDEMLNPTWFSYDELPLEKMIPDDEDWLPLVLNGKKIKGNSYLGPYQQKKLRPTEIWEVDEFLEE